MLKILSLIIFFSSTTSLFLIFLWFLGYGSSNNSKIFNLDSIEFRQDLQRLRHQRNELAQRLNLELMFSQQQKCLTGKSVAKTGGWCKSDEGSGGAGADGNKSDEGSGGARAGADRNKSGEALHFTDKSLVEALVQLFQQKTVASFGDGLGKSSNKIFGILLH